MEKTLAQMTFVEVLDKNINQEQLAKDLVAKYAANAIADMKAKVVAGEIDPIPGTQLDNSAMLAVIEMVEKALGL